MLPADEPWKPPAVFGYADGSGRRLLIVEPIDNAPALTSALCPGGKPVAVKHVGRKESKPGDTGRDGAANFDHAAGHHYEIAQGSTSPDVTCLLMEPSFLEGRTLLVPESLQNHPASPADRERIAGRRARKVTNAWELVRLDDSARVLLVEFERRGSDCLASLVLLTPARLVFDDHLAEYDEFGTWRVDDGGVIEPMWFDIPFVYKVGSEYGIGVAWTGAEGINLRMIESAGEAFTVRAEGYRYLSPA